MIVRYSQRLRLHLRPPPPPTASSLLLVVDGLVLVEDGVGGILLIIIADDVDVVLLILHQHNIPTQPQAIFVIRIVGNDTTGLVEELEAVVGVGG